MITITINLNKMTAFQIAALDAALHDLGQVPSKIKTELVVAGETSCGTDEYDRIYELMVRAIEDVK